MLDKESSESSEVDVASEEEDNNDVVDLSYQNEAYWNLPEQVREAIDKAKIKNNKSEFYYKLKDMKLNIKRYQGLF